MRHIRNTVGIWDFLMWSLKYVAWACFFWPLGTCGDCLCIQWETHRFSYWNFFPLKNFRGFHTLEHPFMPILFIPQKWMENYHSWYAFTSTTGLKGERLSFYTRNCPNFTIIFDKINFNFFKVGSNCVSQAGLELSEHPDSTSWILESTFPYLVLLHGNSFYIFAYKHSLNYYA